MTQEFNKLHADIGNTNIDSEKLKILKNALGSFKDNKIEKEVLENLIDIIELRITERGDKEWDEFEDQPAESNYDFILLLEFLQKNSSEKAIKLLKKIKPLRTILDFSIWQMESKYKLFLQFL